MSLAGYYHSDPGEHGDSCPCAGCRPDLHGFEDDVPTRVERTLTDAELVALIPQFESQCDDCGCDGGEHHPGCAGTAARP